MAASGTIRAGIGGWSFEPWEGTFYPDGLARTRQLKYASRQLPTIEINGTYYRSQKPAVFAKWASEVPDGFVFALKGNRFVTNRRVLSEAGESIERFLNSGLAELGDRLGPILWQFAPTKKFDPEDFESFLELLPNKLDGLPLRHVVEVRHPSFVVPEFPALARTFGVAICYAHHSSYPEIPDVTADFIYARLQRGEDSIPTAYTPGDLDLWAGRAKVWAEGGMPGDLPLANKIAAIDKSPRDVFVYFIHEGKIRAPQAAQAFMDRVH
ncbi:DUF72 domain-containing protein [Chelativorans sp. Marseille-P2723]|uniref:DUF72 domain-containing protein n=1 Tax=Chelativorans sp. Marseille-P2723 TaxID=2709133 RepID=UPI001570CA0A|nr:DUF72 domain-containing protein [Chelativorans sp. Marseille-P2723]